MENWLQVMLKNSESVFGLLEGQKPEGSFGNHTDCFVKLLHRSYHEVSAIHTVCISMR